MSDRPSWATSSASPILLGVKLRAHACYWTYCLLFVVVPIAVIVTALVHVEAPEPLYFAVGALLFMTLYGGPGEHIYRWWGKQIWGLERE
jgi:hypothetical protein